MQHTTGIRAPPTHRHTDIYTLASPPISFYMYTYWMLLLVYTYWTMEFQWFHQIIIIIIIISSCISFVVVEVVVVHSLNSLSLLRLITEVRSFSLPFLPYISHPENPASLPIPPIGLMIYPTKVNILFLTLSFRIF